MIIKTNFSNNLIIENNGFTIIETLVAIILLGLVSTMSIMVFNQTGENKRMMLKRETYVYKNEEIDAG